MSVPSSYKAPGFFLTLVFGVGTQSPLEAPRKVLIVDYGTAGPLDEITALTSADFAGATFGYGSHIHLAAIAAFEEYPSLSLYALRYAEAGGGVAAQQTLTITGNATTSGTLYLDLNGLQPKVETVVNTGDTPTTQAAAVAVSFNKYTSLPMTASAALGVVTFTWKHKGEGGNQAKLRYSTSNIAGSTYAIASTVAGATDGDPSTALDSIAQSDEDFISTGLTTSDATTGLGKLVKYANDRSAPLIGLRGVVVAAFTGSFGGAVALALTQNAHRLQLGWCRNADALTCEIAAKLAAIRALEEGNDPASNLDFRQFAGLRGPRLTSDRISQTEANLALNSGVTALGFTPRGVGYLFRSITTRFQDVNGAPDYRVLDTSKVAVVDYFADDLASDYLVTFPRMKLRKDATNQKPAKDVLTPSMVQDWLTGKLYAAQDGDPAVLENVEEHMPELVVVKSAVVPGRIEGQIPLDVIEGAHQFDLVLNQIG